MPIGITHPIDPIASKEVGLIRIESKRPMDGTGYHSPVPGGKRTAGHPQPHRIRSMGLFHL
jgi:hypothetical protein